MEHRNFCSVKQILSLWNIISILYDIAPNRVLRNTRIGEKVDELNQMIFYIRKWHVLLKAVVRKSTCTLVVNKLKINGQVMNNIVDVI